MNITKDFLQSLNPCKDRWENYLEHYSDWSGTFVEFLELDKITTEDKLWVFTRKIVGLERAQRRFAVVCAGRACADAHPDIQRFFALVKSKYEQVNYESDIEHLKDDEYMAASRAADMAADMAASRAADWAAGWAAGWAADVAQVRDNERNVQLELLKGIVKEEKL